MQVIRKIMKKHNRETLPLSNEQLMDAQYDVIAGKMPEKHNEVVLIVDGNNYINELVVYALGLKNQEEFSKDIMAALASGESLESESITDFLPESSSLFSYLVICSPFSSSTPFSSK